VHVFVLLSVDVCVLWLFCFFFSSRRRHTRFSRDWSSDVCSSDLRSRGGASCAGRACATRTSSRSRPRAPSASPLRTTPRTASSRSEERRVGKECRSRWSTEPERKRKERGEAGAQVSRRHGQRVTI